MRTDFGAQLDALNRHLAQMCRATGAAMELATQALMNADLVLAEQVIGEADNMSLAGSEAEEAGVQLLHLRVPEAGELRAVIGSIQIVADLDRMAALALHVAKVTRRRHPQHVLPAEMNGYFDEMGRIAVDLAQSACQVIVSHDLSRARYIREADDAMDDLHRHLFTVLMERDWRHGTAAAVDVTLLGRYYERFADHAVEISRRVIFQATGQTRSEERIFIPRLR